MSQENHGVKTLLTSADLLVYRRLKLDGSQNYVYANAGEEFVAVSTDNTLNGQPQGGALRTSARTFKMTASGVIAAGATIYGDINGKISTTVSGNPIGIALEAATADGDIIECFLNNGAAGTLDGASTGIVADGGNGAFPVIFAKQGITDASGAGVTIVTAPYKFRIINWWVVARDTTAANVKLNNNGTDATANIAKGTVNDTIVPGGTIVAAQKDVLAASPLKAIASVAGAFDVFVMVIKV